MSEEVKEHINNLINNFNNMTYTEQQEELLELYKTGEVEYVNVVDKYSNLVKRYKQSQNNWNKLKKCLEEKLEKNKRDIFLSNNSISSSLISCENDGLRYSLNKMQELEEKR